MLKDGDFTDKDYEELIRVSDKIGFPPDLTFEVMVAIAKMLLTPKELWWQIVTPDLSNRIKFARANAKRKTSPKRKRRVRRAQPKFTKRTKSVATLYPIGKKDLSIKRPFFEKDE